MKSWMVFSGCALACFVFGPASALAQVAQYAESPVDNRVASLTERLESLEAELAQMKRQGLFHQASHVKGGCADGGCDCGAHGAGCGCDSACHGGGCDSACDGGCCDEGCCPAPHVCCLPAARRVGWEAGAEITMLNVYSTLGTGGVIALVAPPVAPVNTFVDFGYNPAPRFWLGYTNCDGLGVRARYWDYDHNAAAVGGPAAAVTFFQEVDVSVFDLEVVDTKRLSDNWEVTLSGGVRYVDFQEIRRDFVGGALLLEHAVQFSGFGLTLSGESRRDLGMGFGLFANVRGSLLYATETTTFRVPPAGLTAVDPELNNVKGIFETQLGVDWTRELGPGALTLRTGVEGQYWNSFSGVGGITGGESIGFFGFTTGASYVY